MSELLRKLEKLPVSQDRDKAMVINDAINALEDNEYRIAEIDGQRPWGAFIRLDNQDADRFVDDFFPNLDPVSARLGDAKAALSPKILVVAPEERLSWQYHNRRAELWRFLNNGAYYKSLTDEMGDLFEVESGDIVQFEQGERHRLVGAVGFYTLVAEIWQHTDKRQPSDEDDIVRVADDYRR